MIDRVEITGMVGVNEGGGIVRMGETIGIDPHPLVWIRLAEIPKAPNSRDYFLLSHVLRSPDSPRRPEPNRKIPAGIIY